MTQKLKYSPIAYTEQLRTESGRFGNIEIDEAGDLLKAYSNHHPDFLGGGIKVEFNPQSGYVFLLDAEYHVGMLNDEGKLEQWHNCPECGNEGFLEDLKESANDCCMEWLKESGLIDNDEDDE